MKDPNDIARAVCRWFMHDDEATAPQDLGHMVEVIQKVQADALRHAADAARKNGHDANDWKVKSCFALFADLLEVEAAKLEGK